MYHNNRLMYINAFLIACFVVITNHVKSESISSSSKLNTIELENFKYQIDIDKELKISSEFASHPSFVSSNLQSDQIDTLKLKTEEKLDQDYKESNIFTIKSIHGQAYECHLPDLLNEINDEGEDDFLDQLKPSFFESSSNYKRPNQKSIYNYTLIDEKIKRAMDYLKSSNLCIYRNLGWWTYEFCFGHYATQYHVLGNGSIAGEKINLGNFTKDFNWLEANTTDNYPISSGILYHEQYYEMGSICELNGLPRRTVAKIFCDEGATNQIDLISEVETCIYEIHINTDSICKIPNFSKKPNNFDIKCNPVVSPDVYEKYSKKKNEIAKVRTEKEQQRLKNLKAEQKETDKSTDLDNLDKLLSQISDKKTVKIETIDATTDNVLEKISSIIKKVGITREEESKKEKVEEEKSKDEKDDIPEDDSDIVKEKLDTIHKEIRDEIAKSENTITNLKENAKKFESLLSEVNSNKLNGEEGSANEKIGEAKTILSNTVDKFMKTDELFNKLTKRLNKLIDELEYEETYGSESLDDEEDDDDENDIIKELLETDKIKETMKPAEEKKEELGFKEEIDQNDKNKVKVTILNGKIPSDTDESTPGASKTAISNEEIKKLENAIAEKLVNSDLNKKFKTNKVQVKIITFDPSQTSLKALSEDDSDSINTLIASLFETDQQYERLKRLKSNYESVYDTSKIENLKADEDGAVEDNAASYLYDEDSADELSDDPEKMIIY